MCSTDITSLISENWGHIDWSVVWSSLLSRNQECRRQECATIWISREKAEKYWAMVQDEQDRYLPIIQRLPVRPGIRVLDIGGGPGTVAIPLAEKGALVTVVEPADGMIAVLNENLHQRNLSAVQVIQSRWEDLDTTLLSAPYDLVIACFSLGMCDIGACIRKMQAVAAGEVHLIWFQQQSSWEQIMVDLWPSLYGAAYQQGPKGDLLYLVLSQLGIAADVSHRSYEAREEYASLDDAVIRIMDRIGVVDEDKKSVIREYVKKNFIQDDDGYLWNGATIISMFSWKVTPAHP